MTRFRRLFRSLLPAALCCAATLAHAAGFALIEVPADKDGPALRGAVWSPCSTPPGRIDLAPLVLHGTRDCPVAGQGLPLVVVNPAAPIGPWDIKPTPTGKIVVDFLRRKLPAYLDTGLNLIDVRDVAYGHLLAARHGKIGERYIFGHCNMSLRDIFHLLAEVSGLPAPRWRIPMPWHWRLAM